MANRHECFVLLRTGWRPPMAEIAAAMQQRYPELGRVAGTDAPAESGMPGTLLLDGVTVSVTIVNAPYPLEQMFAPVRLLNHVDPESLVAAQLAYVMLGVEGPDVDQGMIGKGAAEQAEVAAAYAALLTLIAGTICAQAPALGAFWSESWRLMPPDTMTDAAERVMEGELPLDVWISYAEVKGNRAGGPDNRAMLSFGLRRFCGREVEVAGAPMSLAAMEKLARAHADRLRAGNVPMDNDGYDAPGGSGSGGGGGRGILRMVDRFMRPRQPALVIVPPDSSVDPETLEMKGAKKSGIAGRLFGRR
ncbi:MAG: hypothetical protein AAF577_06140 [Pseudomonadota bacterium]